MAAATEVVLKYDHSIAPQERYYDCGAASAQIVLNGLGVITTEAEMIRECHTTENGTDYVGLVEKALNGRVPDARYVSVYINDPPSAAEKDTMWNNISSSILNGYGVVMNWVVPPGNRPRSIKGDTDLSYSGGGVIFHYVTAMGVDTAEKAIFVADPGFRPFAAWITADQCATLIAPKGYCYATGPKREDVPSRPVTAEPPVVPARTGFSSVSPYRVPNEPAIGGIDRFVINEDATLHLMFVEYSAMVLGDEESIARVVRSAAGAGAVTDPSFIARARRVLAKVPKDDLAAVLLKVQQQDPQWIDALRSAP